MSYNQKPTGAGNSGMGGTGPPNGPNNTQQVAKTLAGIQQQMQNFVHVQNALPQSSQADFNTLLQQQRFQNIIKQQQQQFFHQHFQQQIQQQQQQQHQQQQQNKERAGTEPLALTRTPAAAELLNKTYQQHHQQHPNGNPNATNSSSLNPFQQQLQVIPPNIVQQLQAFQLQMQQHQQQQQHHSQTQQPQHHTSNPSQLQTLPPQQLHGQTTQQQKTSALTTAAAVAAAQLQQRYLSAAVSAQTAVTQTTSGNKVVATPPPPPPLTANQIKPPNLPPSTQITPIPATSGNSQATIKSTSGNSATTAAALAISTAKQVPPTISLLPSKTTSHTSTSVASHHQNKFTTNKNSTPTTNASTAPLPAHVQKPTKSTVPSTGNSTILSVNVASLDISAKSTTNSEIVAPVSTTKSPQKPSSSQTTKINAPPAATLASSVANTVKTQPPHANATTKQTTTSFQSQLPPPKSLQQSVKTTESKAESTAQGNQSAASQENVAKLTSSQESKIHSEKHETKKGDEPLIAEKVEISKDNTSSASEHTNSTKSTAKKALDQSTVVSVEKEAKTSDAQTKEMAKNDRALVKANNNNVAEKSSKSIEKEQALSSEVQNRQSDTNKIATKESIEKNATQTTVKPVGTETRDRSEQKFDTDKKPINTALTKTATEESNLSTVNQNNTEQNRVHNEKSLEVKEPKNHIKKDKDNWNDDDAISSKVDKTESKDSFGVSDIATALTPQAKSKMSKEVESTVAGTESAQTKKQSRHPKLNKQATAATTSASSSNQLAEVVEKIEKSEKVEKISSNRTIREDKRITQNMLDNETPTTSKATSSTGSDRKSQRHRLKTILYQSPLPELAYITKLSASEASNSPKPMPGEDKLIVFYKNEYMAVRNAEGTFYLCQTMQNVYRTSPRISIRWLSEDAKDNSVYIPDFYDHTDIECVLTTVELKRIDKGHLRLPQTEKARIENILKKAIDVEKGLVPRPELSEENPDGLDISLYKDESQIEKKLLSSHAPVCASRNSRRGANAVAARSCSTANTPSQSNSNKRKAVTSGGGTATLKSKSPAKKRKPTTKRKSTQGSISDDDENETSEDHASDAEYKPSQKKSNANSASKSSPRVQRSPLAKARAVSPGASTSTAARSKNAGSKIINSTPIPSRSERAIKRKHGGEVFTNSPIPNTKKAATSNTSDAESTSATAKCSVLESIDGGNNDAISSKKSLTESGTPTHSSGSASTAALIEVENTTANGSSSNCTTASNRPTRSRK